jgi:IclR family mhp operon transcriptional activator
MVADGGERIAAQSGVKSVRALERGLDVLLAVRAAGGLGLNALHQQLGLPKATLLRLLQTLASRALVWRRLADGVWMPGMVGAGVADPAGRLAEIASPLLMELSGQVVWPSVIAIPHFDHMEIIETNSPMARFDFAALGPVGSKLSYLHTATGRAYLSACTDDERDAIITRLAPPDASVADRRLLDAIIAQTRDRGWSTRLPHHPWADRNREMVLRDGKTSIAVAVGGVGEPIAALNITWPTRRAQVEEVVAQHLASLQAISTRISQRALSEGFTR